MAAASRVPRRWHPARASPAAPHVACARRRDPRAGGRGRVNPACITFAVRPAARQEREMGSNVRSAPPLLQIGAFLVALLLVLPWMAHQQPVTGIVAYLLAGALGVWSAARFAGPEDRVCVEQQKHLIFIGWPLFLAFGAFQSLLEIVGTDKAAGQAPAAKAPLPAAAPKAPAPVAAPAPAPVAKAPPPPAPPAAPAPAPVAKAPPPAPAAAPAPPPPAAKAPPPAAAPAPPSVQAPAPKPVAPAPAPAPVAKAPPPAAPAPAPAVQAPRPPAPPPARPASVAAPAIKQAPVAPPPPPRPAAPGPAYGAPQPPNGKGKPRQK